MTHEVIMRQNVFSRLRNNTGIPPNCRVCHKTIKVGEKYVQKVVRTSYIKSNYAVYCVSHAKEKNII